MEDKYALIYPYVVKHDIKSASFRNNVLLEYFVPIMGLLYKNVDNTIAHYTHNMGQSDKYQNLFKIIICESSKYISTNIELFSMMLPIKYEVVVNGKVLPLQEISQSKSDSEIDPFKDVGEIKNAYITIYDINEDKKEDIITIIFTYEEKKGDNILLGSIKKYDDIFLAMNPMMETYLRRLNMLYAFNEHFADCDFSEKVALKILINLFDAMLICDSEKYPKKIHRKMSADFTVSQFKNYIDNENKSYREIILDIHSCLMDVLKGKTEFKECKYYHLENIFYF